MCTEGALAMHSSSNCVLYLCTGVVVTISYSCVLEIQQRPCIRAVSWVSSNYSHCPTKSCVHHYYSPLPYQKLCPSLLQPIALPKVVSIITTAIALPKVVSIITTAIVLPKVVSIITTAITQVASSSSSYPPRCIQ